MLARHLGVLDWSLSCHTLAKQCSVPTFGCYELLTINDVIFKKNADLELLASSSKSKNGSSREGARVQSAKETALSFEPFGAVLKRRAKNAAAHATFEFSQPYYNQNTSTHEIHPAFI